jgi:hypothetical protein
MRASLLIALAAAGCAAPTFAECPAGGMMLPVEYAAWTSAQPLISAADAKGLNSAEFVTAEAFDIRLHPDGEVTYLTLPKGAGDPASFGGLARFEVKQAGTYRVALGDFAWVDVDRDGKPLDPVSFGHGPKCTAVKKIVDYKLEPGTYALEISGNTAPQLRLMLLRL